MQEKIDRMKTVLLEFLPSDRRWDTDIPGLALFRRDMAHPPQPMVYKPQVILMAQGQKHVYLGHERYTYDPEHYFVLTLALPVLCEAIIEPGKPLLGMVLDIDPQIIGEILYGMDMQVCGKSVPARSLYEAKITDSIFDAALRLLESLKSPNDKRILGPLYLKELLYRILSGEQGEVLADLARNNQHLSQISRVIRNIHEHYSSALEIQDLAREAGMSPSAFHSNFRDITSTSPLQYIKNIRLHKAKELIQQQGRKAYEAAIQVGYESSSQFNREYKRLFGVTPARDTKEVPI